MSKLGFMKSNSTSQHLLLIHGFLSFSMTSPTMALFYSITLRHYSTGVAPEIFRLGAADTSYEGLNTVKGVLLMPKISENIISHFLTGASMFRLGFEPSSPPRAPALCYSMTLLNVATK